METVKTLDKRTRNLRIGAKIALVVLLFNVLRHVAAVYRTKLQMVNPLIPESITMEIIKQHVFHATVSTIASIIGLALFFFDKYLLVIILVALTIIADRFVYL